MKSSKKKQPVYYKRPRITDEQIGAALVECKGNVSAAARKVGRGRSVVHQRIKHNEELQQILSDARESFLDEAEEILQDKIRGGETVPLLFFLKTQGKKRGYIERSEVDQKKEVLIRRQSVDVHLSPPAIEAQAVSHQIEGT